MKGPCAPRSRLGAWWIGNDRRRAGTGGVVRFYKSQCKSRDKYYLLFEERHSRYLLYRGRGPVLSGTRARTRSKENSSEEPLKWRRSVCEQARTSQARERKNIVHPRRADNKTQPEELVRNPSRFKRLSSRTFTRKCFLNEGILYS